MDMTARSPWFRAQHAERVGTFIMTKSGRRFHASVLCKEVTSDPDLAEVDIVERIGNYYALGRLDHNRNRELQPCAYCQPLDVKPFKLASIDTTHAPCLGRDKEWVQEFRSKPMVILDPQRECMSCDQLETCFEIAKVERPDYGITGGVTPLQLARWGDNALENVRALIANEDTPKDQPTRAAISRSGTVRGDRGSGTSEGTDS